MMSHDERKQIEAALLTYAETKASGYKYAYAFGVVIPMLTDEQMKTLDGYVTEWSK